MYRWSRATQYDMFHNQDKNEKIHQDNVQAGKEMHDNMPGLLEERRKALEQNPDLDDTVSRLLKSRFVDAIEFDEQAIMRNIMGLLVGGVETTSQAVVQIMAQLFKRPQQFEAAKNAAKENDDQILYQYCWEALRFNPINPFVIRYCAEDYKIAAGTLRSKTIKKGSTVLVCTRSAMRDGRQLPAANSFCIDRPHYHYMHLGYGEHTCLGDQISRVQIPEIVKHLLLLPDVKPEGEMDFEGGPFPEKYVLTFN